MVYAVHLSLNKIICITLALLMQSGILIARTLEVGPGKAYTRLQDAAMQAKPGDVILLRAGIYPGNDFIPNLKGAAAAWITIKAAPKEQVIFRGGQHAFQLSNPAYLKIEGLIFEGQTANGVNIDDGGTYRASAHHILIENCEWRNMTANGNNDNLKLSGLEDFTIRKCRFMNGSKNGSLLDMVGCHRGIIEENIFQNGGTNSIQAKGGSKNIVIQRNRFTNGGQRAVNIGGSTGVAFFRPNGATYEAAEILVQSNIFTGSDTPFAFVGAINCEVVNNTIVNPKRWAMRILQENNNLGMQACSNNIIRNNIFVLSSAVQVPVNIGPYTAPETFSFAHNLWYTPEPGARINLKLPVSEINSLLNQNPLFTDSTYQLAPGSPAIGKAQLVKKTEKDFYGKNYAVTPAVGAIEFNPSNKKK